MDSVPRFSTTGELSSESDKYYLIILYNYELALFYDKYITRLHNIFWDHMKCCYFFGIGPVKDKEKFSNVIIFIKQVLEQRTSFCSIAIYRVPAFNLSTFLQGIQTNA